MPKLLAPLVLALSIVPIPQLALAQSPDGEPATRADQIEEQRIEKSHESAPVNKESPISKYFGKLSVLTRWTPLRLSVEGLGPGAGLTLSSLLERQSHGGHVICQLIGSAEVDGFYTAAARMELPNLTSQRLTVAFQGLRADSPQLEYYGPGPNSSLHNRTDYRREDNIFSIAVESRKSRHFLPACRAAEWLLNVGPGTNQDLANTQTVFGPSEAPGIDQQSDYFLAECSAQLEFRDLVQDPHKGFYGDASYGWYYAQDNNHFSFYRLSADAEQYIPFLNQMRVIALMAHGVWSFHNEGQVVPFYLQPTLASDTELRGYRRYRFYDENSLAATVEYRWEISTGFD